MFHSNKKHRIYPYISNGRFYNYPGEQKPHFLLPSIGMLLEWYLCKAHEKKMDVSHWFGPNLPVQRSYGLEITWVGHSTFLIQICGINILTDPIFGNLSLLFPRILPPGIDLEKLPSIDFVIISHNHRDHMDAKSLYSLKQHPEISFLVPYGDKLWFDRRGFNRVFENMWWDKQTFICNNLVNKPVIEFTFLPAYHWSQRNLFDYNRSLWGSWMIKINGILIYFAGDTAYSDHFKVICEEFDPIDIAIMPIGPCEPRPWMKKSHVNAEEAGQAFLDLKASHFIPMHWGTYYFGIDSFSAPYDRFVKWWNEQNFGITKQFHTLKIGQRKSIILPQIDIYKDKTRDIIVGL